MTDWMEASPSSRMAVLASSLLQPLVSGMAASTMPVTPQLQIFCCSASTSARS